MKKFANKFKSKFEALSEQAIERYQQGGYINGDYIKFSSKYKSSDFYKKAGEHVQAMIDEFAESDLNIRVSAVKAIRPAIAPVDGGMNAADGFYLDVSQELAPGLYPRHITVPSEIVQMVDTPDAMGRVSAPDSQVYKANIHGAEEVETSDADRSNPKKNTKLAKSNKWQDSPGGGNAPKTVFGEKKTKKKNDEEMIEEAYASIYEQQMSLTGLEDPSEGGDTYKGPLAWKDIEDLQSAADRLITDVDTINKAIGVTGLNPDRVWS